MEFRTQLKHMYLSFIGHEKRLGSFITLECYKCKR